MKRKHIGSSVASLIAMGLVVSVTTGCAPQSRNKEEVNDKNLVQAGDPNVVKKIGDSKSQYTIIGTGALRSQIKDGTIEVFNSVRVSEALEKVISQSRFKFRAKAESLDLPHSEPSDTNLIFGLPIDQMGKPMIFGSVITQVSDQKSVDLGNLKLADLPPFQIVALPHKNDDSTFGVALMNCAGDCSKSENFRSLIDIPVSGIDVDKKLVFLDLASLGNALDLVAIRKGDPSLEMYKSKASKTVKFDYSQSTLVFDVEAHLVDAKADLADAKSPETVITNRWYLRSLEGLNPSFISRSATAGVGYFLTENAPQQLIQRWDFDQKGEDEGIKYYVKHVPQQFQSAFAGSFDEWNNKLYPILHKKVFSYEFIPENDPRNDLLVAGDVRYNVVEWDLNNKASYGGLGPSLANPYSGEIFHANVLVQGPTVVEMYTHWFKAQKQAEDLQEMGQKDAAELLIAKAQNQIHERLSQLGSRSFELTFGGRIKMRIRSQDPAYKDKVVARDDFDVVPVGYDFQTYMEGYFHDMVTHELGHDLGLRHNFKGSLGAEDASTHPRVSRSVMEYLGRGYRYLDRVGPYDLMAIQYGYKGIAPKHLDWYCTDEDATRDLSDPALSPECTPNDATDDPFGFFVSRFSHAMDLAVAKGKSSAPDWSLTDMKGPLTDALVGLGSYALSVDETSKTWTNFFNKGSDRPELGGDVKGYVLQRVKSVICDSSLADILSMKESDEAKEKTNANLTEFRAHVGEILTPVFKANELACN